MTDAYPLKWPDGWPRTPSHKRQDSKYRFKRTRAFSSQNAFWTFAEARDSLIDELRKLGATGVVISSDYALRRDGLPLASQRRPDDTGIAVYFMLDGRQMVMAQDTHARAEENLRSLALAVEAMRQLERHGGGQMMQRAFDGFTALPSPDAPPQKRPWRDVLKGFADGTPANLEAAKQAYRRLSKLYHPDGSDPDPVRLAEISQAYEEAQKELA